MSCENIRVICVSSCNCLKFLLRKANLRNQFLTVRQLIIHRHTNRASNVIDVCRRIEVFIRDTKQRIEIFFGKRAVFIDDQTIENVLHDITDRANVVVSIEAFRQRLHHSRAHIKAKFVQVVSHMFGRDDIPFAALWIAGARIACANCSNTRE